VHQLVNTNIYIKVHGATLKIKGLLRFQTKSSAFVFSIQEQLLNLILNWSNVFF